MLMNTKKNKRAILGLDEKKTIEVPIPFCATLPAWEKTIFMDIIRSQRDHAYRHYKKYTLMECKKFDELLTRLIKKFGH